jgi:hypothetical protein
MMSTVTTTPAAGRDASAWRGADLASDARWMMHFDDAERTDLLRVLRAGHRPGQSLLAYRRSDFPFGPAALAKIRRAVDEAQHGLGVALLKGFPRESVTPDEFVLLTWAVGLYVGVARPQDRMTRYINRVQDVGTVYRGPTGRGYSSNAELDFHVDGADIGRPADPQQLHCAAFAHPVRGRPRAREEAAAVPPVAGHTRFATLARRLGWLLRIHRARRGAGRRLRAALRRRMPALRCRAGAGHGHAARARILELTH